MREALGTVLELLPDMPHLPELPARGPGAGLIGRGVALLADLHAELQPSGWRFAARPSIEARRAESWLRQDLDALEELTQGYTGAFKLQAAGPWTLPATVELRNGEAALGDPGACRDIAASLAEGMAEHVRQVRRRLPGARLVVQLDEPALPGVLAGSVPTASGFGALPALESPIATEALRQVVDAVDAPVVVHCCAPRPPIQLIRRAGAAGVSLDAGLLTERDDEHLGTAVEAGTALFLGLVPTHPPGGTRVGTRDDTPSADGAAGSDPAGTVSGVRRLWRRLGLSPEILAGTVVVTPTCGLAGASAAYARTALARGRAAARVLLDDPEG